MTIVPLHQWLPGFVLGYLAAILITMFAAPDALYSVWFHLICLITGWGASYFTAAYFSHHHR